MEVMEVMEVTAHSKSLSQTMEVVEVMEVAAYGGFCAQTRLKKSSKGRLVELRSCSLWRIFGQQKCQKIASRTVFYNFHDFHDFHGLGKTLGVGTSMTSMTSMVWERLLG